MGRLAPCSSKRKIAGWVSVGSRSKSKAIPPATCGDDIDEPLSNACCASTEETMLWSGQMSLSPSKMLVLPFSGAALIDIAAATMAPGAEISGFMTPVAVGPAELK